MLGQNMDRTIQNDRIEQNDRIYIKAKIINYQISTNLILEKTYFNSNLLFFMGQY